MLTWYRVAVASAANAFADFKMMYTPTSWLFGWLTRMLFQVAFYALIGTLLGSPERQRYLLVGAAAMAMVTEVMLVCASTAWERRAGTLPLLVVAPVDYFPVFVGRSVQWIPSSITTSAVSLFAMGPLFGVRWTFATAVPAAGVLVLTCLGTYLFALAVGAVVLNFIELRNVVGAVVSLVTTILSGAVVAVDFWPVPLQLVAGTLPVTHGLRALRTLAEGEVSTTVLVDSALVAAFGLGWALLAGVLLKVLVETGRRRGTLEYSD